MLTELLRIVFKDEVQETNKPWLEKEFMEEWGKLWKEMSKKLRNKQSVSGATCLYGVVEAMRKSKAKVMMGENYDVVITEYVQKIPVIKVVRAITGKGLKEAKELVDQVPARVIRTGSMKDAQNAQAMLIAAGATVEVM